MGLDDQSKPLEGGVALTASADPDAVRKAERAAELARLTAGFEARMAIRPDAPTPTATAEVLFEPKPLERTEALSTLAEARELLTGSRKLEYFETASGWDKLKLKGLPDYGQALNFLRGILPTLKSKKERIDVVLLQAMADADAGQNAIICLLQWLYLKEHFPWTQNDLTEDERKTLDAAEKAIQRIFAAIPHASGVFLGMADQHCDMTVGTAALLANSRGMPGFSDERLLQETAFTGNSFQHSCQWLCLEPEDIEEMRRGDMRVLDLGCGLSDFSHALRQRGVGNTFTMDELSIRELMNKVQRMNPAVRRALRLDEVLAKFEAAGGAVQLESFHIKSKSEDAHKRREGHFDRIFAVDSITQPALCPVYRRNPMAFWRNMNGPLRALSPKQGELRCTTNPYILYSQTDMEAYWLPFLLAMRAGGFEIPGAYDREGKFSFEQFMNRYVRWKPDRPPALRVRRHAASNPDTADRFMQKALAKGASLEKICAEIS
ncbi:hypothetical protein HYW83_03870 [Candidatus Peregrinibacteria bacterium]|nr:hypothetical protein [Candidatus Peregrinibacteria bacterium]